MRKNRTVKLFDGLKNEGYGGILRSKRALMVGALVGPLALVGPAQAANEGVIVLSANRPGCYDLNLSKPMTVTGGAIQTKGTYAAYALYPADKHQRVGVNNSYGEVRNRDASENIQFADHTNYKSGNYKLCLYTDGASTVNFIASGLRGTVRPRLKPDPSKPDFYSNIVEGPTSSVETAQGVHHDLEVTDNSWQIAASELIMHGLATSTGISHLSIQPKDLTNTSTPSGTDCGDSFHTNTHPDVPSSTTASEPFPNFCNVEPGLVPPGQYEATYSGEGVEVNSQLVFTFFKFRPLQN